MIHLFSASNYYSIGEDAVLDLRIPETAPDLSHFRRSAAKPEIRLPSVVALMGPNGSGKTTLLRALVDVVRFVSTPWTADQSPITIFTPFCSTKFANEPTRFCVEFETDWLVPGSAAELFRYELSMDQSKVKPTVLEETLSHFPKGRPRRLFTRNAPNNPIFVSNKFGITPKDDRLKAIRPDSSIISTLALFNVPLAVRIVESLRLFLLATNLMYLSNWIPSTKDVVSTLEKDIDIKNWVEQELQRSDLAIQKMHLKKTAKKDPSVTFSHRGLSVPIPLIFESGGTKRLFHILPQIHLALTTGGTAVLDEIDNDLHVDIVTEIFRKFRSQQDNLNGAQIFVTSHNTGLLDYLEKEELFIVEKNPGGETCVHGAQDIKGLRRDTNLYPKYRAGILGGIPNLG